MSPAATSTKPIRILAIDDDPNILALLRHTFDDPTMELDSYVNPEKALEVALKSPPDLVLTDLSMPGISGLEVIEQLRKQYALDDLPIVVLSALGDEEVILKCFAAGATDYLMKPLQEGALRAKVQLLVSRCRQNRSLDQTKRGNVVFDPDGAWEPEKLVGKVFAGYEIKNKIGQGGMGVVYKAHCMATGQTVALKVLAPEYAQDKHFLKRFFREATNMEAVDHVNIAKFLELGHESMTYFIAMEFVDGPSLEDYLQDKDLLPEVAVVELVIQIAEALNALHLKNIIHRDIKPGNVLMAPGGVCKLVDFGLTKRPTDKRLTQTNIFFGTASYMSPEQARGTPEPDIRSDIYSLGVLFYFLCTGDLPFDGDDTYEILYKQVHENPVDPQEVNPLLTDTTNFTILKMMRKSPDERYQTPKALLEHLNKHYQFLCARSGRQPRVPLN